MGHVEVTANISGYFTFNPKCQQKLQAQTLTDCQISARIASAIARMLLHWSGHIFACQECKTYCGPNQICEVANSSCFAVKPTQARGVIASQFAFQVPTPSLPT